MRFVATRVLPALIVVGVVLALIFGTSDDPVGQGSERAALSAQPLLRPVARRAAVPRRPHVILLILDEFPADSLLARDGRIDPVRYPNFAALAGNATWFPNAHTVYDSTTKAVPLILDGIRPRPGTSADRSGHPRSIFDMFARRRYRIVSAEEASAICPPRFCRGAPTRRPAILPHLGHGRPERFERFLRTIRPGRPGFWVKHMLLPHGPYLYLPSGAQTRPGARDPLPGMLSVPGFHDPFLTRHNEQRYLLQLGYVDGLIGRLLRRLDQLNMYDDTLIAVTADHGFAWQVGVETRRSVRDWNVEELAPVPLIVKAPGQRRPRINRAYARTLDVAPTIADVLDFRLGYRTDGRSAFSDAVRRLRVVRLPTRDFSAIVRLSGRRWEARRRRVVRRRLRQLGSGDWASLYTGIGPNRALLGRRTDELQPAAATRARASIARESAFSDVRRATGIVPTQIAGDLRGPRAGRKRDLAVAVNGRIEAVGRSFYLKGDVTEHFALNVPEASLREGQNTVELFEVGAGGRLRLLATA